MKRKFISMLLVLCIMATLLPSLNLPARAVYTADYTMTQVYEGAVPVYGNVISISSAAELGYLAEKTNSSWGYGSGLTFYLTGNIDLNPGITFTYDTDIGLVAVSNGSDTFWLGSGNCGDESGGNTTFDSTASVAGTVYTDQNGTTGTAPFSPAAWTPIGCGGTKYFKGAFDGNGFTVSGIYLNTTGDTNYAGLFGYVISDNSMYPANFSNLTISNSYLQAHARLAGMAASIDGNKNTATTISSCSSSAILCQPVNANTGGLVAEADYVSFQNCSSSGVVTGSSYYAGGVVGLVRNGTVTACHNSGFVSTSYSNGRPGGVIGQSEYGSISGCYNTGTVCNANGMANGVAAFVISGTAQDCYNTGSVSAQSAYGVFGFAMDSSSVQNCYNTGSVSGISNAAGVIGDSNGTSVTACYNSGTISVSAGGTIGGVICYSESTGTVQYCYNTGSITGIANAEGWRGGVAAYSAGSIQYCYNTGTISGNGSYVGGVCGKNDSVVEYCYNTGSISNFGQSYSYNYVGGVVGYNTKTTQYCYNAGSITNSKDYAYIGGVTGSQGTSVSNCYYDNQMCTCAYGIGATSSSTGAEGKSTAFLTSGTALDSWSSGDSGTWNFTSKLYPRLTGYVDGTTDYQMDETFAAYLSAAAVWLADSDTTASVTSDFSVSNQNGIGWASSKPGVISIANDTVSGTGTGTVVSAESSGVTLTAALDSLTKTVSISCVSFAHSVTYDSGGGSGALPVQSNVLEGSNFTVASGSGLSREGYVFACWNDGNRDYASGNSYTMGTGDVTFTAVWKWNAPAAAPVVSGKTNNSITVGTQSGLEYAIKTAAAANYGAWQTSGAFTGLSAGTTYNIVSRAAASGNVRASDSSPVCTAATKSVPSAPTAPTLVSKTNIALTVTAVSGQEYSIDTGATWQDTGVFSGLNANTFYEIVTRVKETGSAAASANSTALSVTTKQNAPKQIMALLSSPIASPVMIKGKLTKCCAIMKVKAVKSLV